MRFQCTSCEKFLRINDALAGKRIKCPACGAVQVAEEALDPEVVDEAPAPKKPASGITAKAPAKKSAAGVTAKPPVKKRPPVADDEDEDEAPPPRKRRRDDDDDDDEP